MKSWHVLNRLAQMVIVMWIVSTLVFFIFRVLPGDEVSGLLGVDGADESVRSALEHKLGLDRSLIVQYGQWIAAIAHGNLGTSPQYGDATVTSVLAPAIGHSAELAILGLLLGVLISVPLGISAGARVGTRVDHLARALSVSGFSIPSFWLGILLLLLFTSVMHWFPSGGYADFEASPVEHLRHLALPVLTVGIMTAGSLTRFMRSSMVGVLAEDYIRTARAKGIAPWLVNYRHALRNSSLPFITVVGLELGQLLGGMIVIEQVFAWPGLGQLTIKALEARAYTVVQGSVLVAAAAVVLANLAVDLTYSVLDPRLRRG